MNATRMLPAPPPEPPCLTSLDLVAPKLKDRFLQSLDSHHKLGYDSVVAETLRLDTRQAWLFGFGRDYDDPGDPRGIVTNAPTGQFSWHLYGLAIDIRSFKFGDQPPGDFWYNWGKIVRSNGLTWGGDWPRFTDRPHTQFGPPMRQSPSSRAAELLGPGANYEAVWREVGAL